MVGPDQKERRGLCWASRAGGEGGTVGQGEHRTY